MQKKATLILLLALLLAPTFATENNPEPAVLAVPVKAVEVVDPLAEWKKLTYEEKVEQNPHKCDLNTEILYNSDGTCHKRPYEAPRAVLSAPADVSGNIAIGKQKASQRGWTGSQWDCLYTLWFYESGWNNNAQNPTSTAYGIPQFLNGTWAGTGYAKTSDPTIQIKAGLVYIKNRYATPCGALQHFDDVRWY